MTKLRPPLSFEDGICRVAGHLGWPEAAAAIDKKERTLRDYSDPDVQQAISLDDALQLDRAYALAGGEGAPMLEAFALQLELSNRAVAGTGAEIARRAAKAAKEVGDALAALFAASRPNADAADKRLALREVREGVDALRATLPVLDEDGEGGT